MVEIFFRYFLHTIYDINDIFHLDCDLDLKKSGFIIALIFIYYHRLSKALSKHWYLYIIKTLSKVLSNHWSLSIIKALSKHWSPPIIIHHHVKTSFIKALISTHHYPSSCQDIIKALISTHHYPSSCQDIIHQSIDLHPSLSIIMSRHHSSEHWSPPIIIHHHVKTSFIKALISTYYYSSSSARHDIKCIWYIYHVDMFIKAFIFIYIVILIDKNRDLSKHWSLPIIIDLMYPLLFTIMYKTWHKV